MKELLQNYLGITELESQLFEVVEKLNNQVSSIHARLDSLENIITDSGRAISELESNPPAPHNTLAIEMILKRLDELETSSELLQKITDRQCERLESCEKAVGL